MSSPAGIVLVHVSAAAAQVADVKMLLVMQPSLHIANSSHLLALYWYEAYSVSQPLHMFTSNTGPLCCVLRMPMESLAVVVGSISTRQPPAHVAVVGSYAELSEVNRYCGHL